jgi:hypothetical protein
MERCLNHVVTQTPYEKGKIGKGERELYELHASFRLFV